MTSSSHAHQSPIVLDQLAGLISAKEHYLHTSEIAAEHVMQLAIEQGVTGPLYLALKNNKHSQVALASLAHNHFQHHALRSAVLDKQYLMVLHALCTAGVQFIVLKGFALAHTLYPSPAIRSRSDLDILIRPEQQFLLKAVMSEMGYHNPRGWQPNAILNQFSMRKTLSAGLNVDFDIHLRISNDLALQDILHWQGVLPEAETFNQTAILLIGKVDGFIHAIVHLLHHRNVGDQVKLLWLYDLLLFCETFNTASLQHLTREIDRKGLAEVAVFALTLADQRFDSDKIKSLIQLLKILKSAPRFRYLMNIDTQTQTLRRALSKRHGSLEKWRYVKEVVLPPRQEIFAKYGNQPLVLLPYFYLRRVLGGMIKYLKN